MKPLLSSLAVLVLVACNKGGAKDEPAASTTPNASVGTSTSPPAPHVASATATPPDAAAPPPASSTAPVAELSYAVIGVASDDVLNVREKPDPASKKVYSFGPTGKGIRSTGQRLEKGGTPWIEIVFDGGTGWVNRTYLSENHPGGCNDPEVAALIRALMKAVTASDGAAFKATISPLTGLSVMPEGRAVRIPYAQVDAVFNSKTVLNVGPGDGGGPDITGTFKDLIVPTLRDSILKKGAQEKCGKLPTGSNAPLPPEHLPATFVSFYYPGQETSGFGDWVTWVGRIEYFDGKPYFVSLQRYMRGI